MSLDQPSFTRAPEEGIRRRPLRGGAPALLSLLLLFSGCAWGLRAADRSFEAGDFPRAASRYEAYLDEGVSGAGRERALFRLILLYSSPETPVQDAERSQKLREMLVEEFPGGPYGSWVSWQFFLERRIGILKDNLESQRTQIEALGTQLQAAEEQVQQSQARSQALQKELDARLAEMRSLERELAQAQNEATSQKERMARLTEALELLKKLDLKRTP
ncbi:MAG: hypothetical protein KDD47_23805 [Acidobacteria bacterium]|nr:hypothetical protein [Acidobacteriota bacterium]